MKGKKQMSKSVVNALRKIIEENGEEILSENIDRVKIRGNEAAVQY